MTGRARRTDEEIVTASESGTVPEVMKPAFTISDDTLAEVTDFASAMALATQTSGPIQTSRGVRVAGELEKARMIGLPIILLEWHFIRSDKFADNSDAGREYVEILCVTQNPDGSVDKWKMTDGSTGIYQQLREYSTNTGRTGGVHIPHGIRVSEYKLDPHTRQPLSREAERGYARTGQVMPVGRTYYVDI